MKSCTSTIILAAVALPLAASFSVLPQPAAVPSTRLMMAADDATKGFSKQAATQKKVAKTKSSGQMKREQQSSKYDELAQTGGQEYSIYVRQFGSDDQSWLPCGSIAVPRGAQVSDAIFA
eukprot:CAMPEP_0119557206 /NCGR_PEP_ID=MMETSP1352-20130426/8946_1 /TAXON_ID=265584 /ORGANISM="Stauroneis constricta, Strain CCMP1120" /LENGTH=119 /DNA_ID=CAMNT_0007604273 /DNA_START=55 /DNA_END=410 /DNA_ORIENTATION=+